MKEITKCIYCGKPAWHGKLCNCCILNGILTELKRGNQSESKSEENHVENKRKNNKKRGK